MTQARDSEIQDNPIEAGIYREKVRFNEVTISELKLEIRDLRAELKNEIRDVRTELKGEIKDVRGEIKDVREEIKDVREEIKDVREEIKTLSQSLGLKLNIGVAIIVVANILLKLFPQAGV